MKSSRRAFLLLLLLLLLVPLTPTLADRQHLAVGWSGPPLLRVCSTSPASVGQVKTAAAYWSNIGWGQFKVETGCSEPLTEGAISFHLADEPLSNDPHGGARSEVMTSDDHIQAVAVYLPAVVLTDTKSTATSLLVHELGHALGFNDVENKGHWMTRNIRDRGPDTTGLVMEIDYE